MANTHRCAVLYCFGSTLLVLAIRLGGYATKLMGIQAGNRTSSGIADELECQKRCDGMLTNSLLPRGDDMPAHSHAASSDEARREGTAYNLTTSTNHAHTARSIIPTIKLTRPKAAVFLDGPDAPEKRQDPQRLFRSLFISDTHLGAKGCRADLLLDFLRCHDAEVIYLVGDIFDNWQPLRSNWSPVHDAIIQNLIGKARAGCRIVYLPGNHDEVFRRHYGFYFDCIEVVERTLHTAADGKRYLVLHGDCFDLVVSRARWLSRIGSPHGGALRSAHALINRIRGALGLAEWSLRENVRSRVNIMVTRWRRFEQRLTAAAHEHGASGVICGHFHSATLRAASDIVYANCGDWIESCTAIAEEADGRLLVISWKTPHPAVRSHDFLAKAETPSTLAI
jgi:UDP-2,3-diacylglucosamine pyrophosphatase LpxH